MSTLRTSVSQQNWLTEIILDIRLRKKNKKTHGASSSSLTRKNSTLKKNCTQNKYCRKIPLRLKKQETEVYLISRKQVHV